MNWRQLEQEISRLLERHGCTLERDAGEMWLIALPEDEFDCDDEDEARTAPVSLTNIAKELEQILGGHPR